MAELLRDEFGERTEQPTPLRLDEARRRGQVAYSRDLTSAVLVLGSTLLLAVLGPRLVDDAVAMMAALLRESGPGGGIAASSGALWSAARPLLADLALLAGGLAAVAVLVNVLQVGFMAAGQRLALDWDRVSLSAGLRRLVSARSGMLAVQSLAKLGAAAAVCYLTLWPAVADASLAAASSVSDIAWRTGVLVLSLSWRIGAALVVLASTDWLFQRWQHLRDLRITPRQLKDDVKRMEGDVRVRGPRVQEARRIASQRLAVDAPRWSAVITAPSGLAVALRFAPPMRSPRLSAKGAGAVARQIAAFAKDAGVVSVEDKELAASIFRRCRAGQEIPPRLHGRVAEMLAYAQRIKTGNPDKHG
ncbi:MAG: EscU/YscU/HrcU family type III secretion system export apparatus switch protein [Phycisphaerae bacterium]